MFHQFRFGLIKGNKAFNLINGGSSMFHQFKKPNGDASDIISEEIKLFRLKSEYHLKREISEKLEAERERVVKNFQKAMVNAAEQVATKHAAAKIAIEKSEQARKELAEINAKILEIEEKRSEEYRKKEKSSL